MVPSRRHARKTAALPASPHVVIEENPMESNQQETGYHKVRQVISEAKQFRKTYLCSTLKTSMTARAGSAGFALLCLTGLACVAVVDTSETDSIAVVGLPPAAIAVSPANYGGAARREQAGAGSAQPADFLSARHVGRGRDGDRNVMTYGQD